MRLSVRHCVAQAFFADVSTDVCVISESTSPNERPRMILGKHGNAMLLTPHLVRELLPHLQTFAATGQMIKPVVDDYSI